MRRRQRWVIFPRAGRLSATAAIPPIPVQVAALARSSASGPGRVRTLAQSARLEQESLAPVYRTPLDSTHRGAGHYTETTRFPSVVAVSDYSHGLGQNLPNREAG